MVGMDGPSDFGFLCGACLVGSCFSGAWGVLKPVLALDCGFSFNRSGYEK